MRATAGLLLLVWIAGGYGASEGANMRVQFLMEGGIAYFPGLSQPVNITTDQLAHAQAAELRQLVEAAGFFDLPAQVGKPARGAADYRQYTVTIEESERRHTVRMIEPIDQDNLKRLIAFLRTKASEIRRSNKK
jgi:hypothetical protein